MCVCVCVWKINTHMEVGKVWKDICKLVGCSCPGGMWWVVFSFVFLFIGIFSFLQGLTIISDPTFLPGESHGQKRLEGCSPQGCRELDTTEVIKTHSDYIYGITPGVFGKGLCTVWHSLMICHKGRVPAGQFYLVDLFYLVREQIRFGKRQLHPFLDEFTLFS